MSDPPAERAPTPNYVLVASSPAENDVLDLYGAIAAWWRFRGVFALACLLSLAPAMYWAFSGRPRVEFSMVLRPALSGTGDGADQVLVPVSRAIVECREIVFPELLAEVDAETQSPTFRGIDPRASGSDIFLVLRVSAPSESPDLARRFLEQASSRVLSLQSEQLDRYRDALDRRIDELEQRIANLRTIVRTPRDPEESYEPSVLAMEIARLDAELSEASSRRTRSAPATEVRGTLDSSEGGESSWRIKRVLAAFVGSIFVGFATAAGCIVISGVRRRLTA